MAETRWYENADWGSVGDALNSVLAKNEQGQRETSETEKIKSAPEAQARQFDTSPRSSGTNERPRTASAGMAGGMGGGQIVQFLTSPMGLVMIAGTGLYFLAQAMDD